MIHISKYNILYNDSILPGYSFAINENIIHRNGIFLDNSMLPENRYVLIESTLTKRYFVLSMEGGFTQLSLCSLSLNISYRAYHLQIHLLFHWLYSPWTMLYFLWVYTHIKDSTLTPNQTFPVDVTHYFSWKKPFFSTPFSTVFSYTQL